MKQVGYPNVSAKRYSNLHHEILLEHNHVLVFYDIEHWLNKLS